MSENEVYYRHIEIPAKACNVSGILLWYTQPEPAYSFFDMVEEYFSKKESKEFIISFDKNIKNNYDLTILIEVGQNNVKMKINDIDIKYINKLINSLKFYQYFFIITGYTDENGTEQITPNCYYNASRLYLDGRLIVGNNKLQYPYQDIKRIVNSKQDQNELC